MYDQILYSKIRNVHYEPMTLKEVIFNNLPHRDDKSNIIYSHIGEEFVSISLNELREIIFRITNKLSSFGLKCGDTVMLASFCTSNELANALLFSSLVCSGIRVFVPMFPEPDEFEYWYKETGFKAVIMPFRETMLQKGHEREKEVISSIKEKSEEYKLLFLDAEEEFSIFELIRVVKQTSSKTPISFPDILPETEAVIFTTSGTSGKSKLLVYTHEKLTNCCQAWQMQGLFSPELFGNPGFSPLFTHTIGIRTFLNSIWSGNSFCLIVTDWFLHKPEIVRLLLLKMDIGHLIAGPAFFNTLLELFRQYPELKAGINQSLKAAISIGSVFDPLTAEKFRTATGISVMNAFGTTETLMITLNRYPESDGGALGELLPGVEIGLQKSDEDSLYGMFIHSPFQSARTIGEKEPTIYFETGDLVYYNIETEKIIFHCRKSNDYFKDGYGVKIPLNQLKSYYEPVYRRAHWIEWIPLINIPGLGVLIFLPQSSNANREDEFTSLIKNANETLKRKIGPFEYAHRHIERFGIVYEEAPLTRKGTISKDQIYKRYGQLIEELRNPFVYSQHIKVVETGDRSDFYKYTNPHVAELLEALKLDKVYEKGEGDYLYYQNEDKMQQVLDLVGGFGANLFGHNNTKIRDAIVQFMETGRPALNNQGSQYYYPSVLARELNRMFSKSTGRYFKVQLGNSGSEATEIALHHAYYEWRQKLEKLRDEQYQLYGAIDGSNVAEVWDENLKLIEQAIPCILVINDCFHGYTSGARSFLNNKKQRYSFSGLLRPNPLHLSDIAENWQTQAQQFLENNYIELRFFKTHEGVHCQKRMKFSTIIASIIEPVRGEGGISEINPELVGWLAVQEFPLVSDEIQCGLGRTGSFPTCKNASYYLLGKSLGGGFEKISVVLIEDLHFKSGFTSYYSSTNANGELAAFTAIQALKIIEKDNLVEIARKKGEYLHSKLQEIASQYPDIIESVRGKGLMIGIHFNAQMGKRNNFLRILIEGELSGYFFAGWLLNKHHIRVLPSLSKSNSIRIEPSFYISEQDVTLLYRALTDLCRLCHEQQIYELCRFLMNGDPYSDRANPIFEAVFPNELESPAENAIRVGFIANLTVAHRELQLIDPDLQKASDTGLRILFNRLQVLLEGKAIRLISKNLMKGRVLFTFDILPFDTSQMEIASRWGKKRFLIEKIQENIDKQAKEGTVSVSLGAHTSIISGNGLNIAERTGCKVLTGNTLTVACSLFYLNQYLQQSPDVKTIAIVGAGGNIGGGLVKCLNDTFYSQYEIVLIGSNEKKLQRLKNLLSSQYLRVRCSTDMFELKKADAIICCANTNDPIVFPHHIRKDKPVFIIDISVPHAVSDAVRKMGNVLICKDASSVWLPDDPRFIMSTHSPAGKVFCCTAESILCGLYNLQTPLKGHINKESVLQLIKVAEEEGFFRKIVYKTNQ